MQKSIYFITITSSFSNNVVHIKKESHKQE